MNLPLAVFLILAGLAFICYFSICIKYGSRPLQSEGLSLLGSSATIAGAVRVAQFAFSPSEKEGLVVAASDITLGAALLAGVVSLLWRGVESIVTTMLDHQRKSQLGKKNREGASKSSNARELQIIEGAPSEKLHDKRGEQKNADNTRNPAIKSCLSDPPSKGD